MWICVRGNPWMSLLLSPVRPWRPCGKTVVFGERTLLGNAAKAPSGTTFDRAAQGMSPGDREKLSTAWPTMRAGQQLAAHERTQQALKHSEAMRQAQTKSQGLKQ